MSARLDVLACSVVAASVTSAGAVTLVPDVDPPQGPRVIPVESLGLHPPEPGRLGSGAGREG